MFKKIDLFLPVQSASTYRPDIDGLRAFAILPVILFHAYPSVFRGGFVGVDIFFVISGYLISTIIYRDFTANKFSFMRFYQRRIRRIFPSLIVVLFATLFIGWFVLLPEEYEQLGKHGFAGIGFVENIILWSESGYFDKSSELKPLMHLWSLAIEEQFYFFFPLLMGVAWKLKLNIPRVFLLIFLGSFCLNVLNVRLDTVGTFFLPHTRFWEILAGGLLSFYQIGARTDSVACINSRSRLNNLSSISGFFIIIFSMLYFENDFLFPGWWASLPVLGTVLIIKAGPEAWINRNILSVRWVVFIGLISYPLYLWHWPILSFVNIQSGGHPAFATRSLVLVLSFFLAWLTFRYIEIPIRTNRRKSFSEKYLVGLGILLGCGGLIIYFTNGMYIRFPAEVRYLATYKYNFKIDSRFGECWIDKGASHKIFENSCENSEFTKIGRVAIWGDSHAARLYPGLKITLGNKGIGQFTRNGCPPILNFGYENCATSNQFIVHKLTGQNYDTVILFSMWTNYLESEDARAEILLKLKETVLQLKQNGIKNIVVVGPNVRWEKDLPKLVFENWKESRFKMNLPSRLKKDFDEEVKSTDKIISKYLKSYPLTYVSLNDFLCNKAGCRTSLPSNPKKFLTWDYGHLTTDGASYVSDHLIKKITNSKDPLFKQ